MKPVTATVLRRLEAHRTATGGWVCGRELASADCGGWRYTARIHELRAAGWVVEREVCDCHVCRIAKRTARAVGRKPRRIYRWRIARTAGVPA